MERNRFASPGNLGTDQRGITGLETAIVLIAFVVVASVFAFAVLSTGLLSSEKSKETVLGGLEETSSTLSIRGDVIGDAKILRSHYQEDRRWDSPPHRRSFARLTRKLVGPFCRLAQRKYSDIWGLARIRSMECSSLANVASEKRAWSCR